MSTKLEWRVLHYFLEIYFYMFVNKFDILTDWKLDNDIVGLMYLPWR